MPSAARLDNPPAFDDVASVTKRAIKHTSEIDVSELPINHPLEEMRAEFELPSPPSRPSALNQNKPPVLPR
jgi:hypothetical protein